MYPGTHALSTPDRAAVVMAGSGRILTYAELEDRSARVANVLRASGLAPGDAVALLSDNTPEAFEVYWAALRSGLYVTAVNSHLTAAEVAYIVNDCGARALIVSARLGDLPGNVLSLVHEQIHDVVVRLAYAGDVPGFDNYEVAVAAASDAVPVDQPCGADILYTSGTTGRPKGIRQVLSARQIDEPGDPVTTMSQAFFGFGPETVYLSPAPVYHAAPLRFSAAVQALGGTVVMMERFDAAAALQAIENHSITHSQWVPTMFVRLLKLPEEVRQGVDLSSHRLAIHAAAPCPAEIKEQMIAWWGPVLWEFYASTEGNGSTVISSPEWLEHRGSVGRPAQGIVRICDADGHELPVGEVGTVYFERDELPFVYLGATDLTTTAQHPDQPTWTTTGDIGRVDADGYLYLTDRASFLIISGGVNISPQEIEDALIVHPSVSDAAVIGVPHPEMGEEVRGVVVLAPDVTPDAETESMLREYLGGRLARYKVPRQIDFVAELPRTPTGKLVKRHLRDAYSAT